MARLLVLNVKEVSDKPPVYEAELNGLSDFYEAIGCDTIDIVTRKTQIGDRYFDVICDDEGLFKEDCLVSAIRGVGDRYEEMLVGNLIFANHDSEGETTSLSDEDIDIIKQNIFSCKRKNTESGAEWDSWLVALDY